MLLKVSKGKGRWVIFDSVSEVDYTDMCNAVGVGSSLQVSFTLNNEKNVVTPDRFIVVNGEKDEIQGYFVSVKYIDGELMTIFFDTIAYLCNDDGRTIERIGGSR